MARDNWKSVTMLLCLFGLLKELRPSEPFITEYIMEFKNMTAKTIMHEIYPVSTYTILATAFVVFLVTDFFRYRPVVILEGLALVATWVILIWGQSLESLIVVEICYGMAISADVAYYTYIYAQVPKEKYKRVTSYTYTAALVGKFIAGTCGQILISFKFANFHELNYISLSCVSAALVLSLFLPSVKQSIYFNRPFLDPITANLPKERYENVSSSSGSCTSESQVKSKLTSSSESSSVIGESAGSASPSNCVSRKSACQKFMKRFYGAFPILWQDFKEAYRNSYILKWSFFWALGTAGNYQVINYTQPLWESIENYHNTQIYNGSVATIQCLLSALASMAVGYIKIEWRTWGEPFLCLISVLQGVSLLVMSQTSVLWIAYGNYITFRVLFQLTITIASSEVAHGINQQSCGLIFGINTFMAMIVQSVLTLVVADKRGLALNETNQFVVYGAYFLVMGFIFLMFALSVALSKCCGRKPRTESVRAHGHDYEEGDIQRN